MKKTMGNIEAKTPSALDWLNNPEGMVGAMGEKALGQVWPTSVCFYVGGKSLGGTPCPPVKCGSDSFLTEFVPG